jgi:hypothetical protein
VAALVDERVRAADARLLVIMGEHVVKGTAADSNQVCGINGRLLVVLLDLGVG